MLRTPPAPVRLPAVAAGSGLVLVVLAAVIDHHYLQIEWHLTAGVPVGWWYAGQAAAVLGGPLFFAAAGFGLGRTQDQPAAVRPALWYAGSVAAVLALLWRYGPGYGLAPIRDLPELLRFLALPPSVLSPSYGLAVFPLVARLVRGLPAPAVLGAGVTVAVLTGVAATQVPVLGTSAELARHLAVFLIGWRLGRAAASGADRPAPPITRPLAWIGHAAVPIAAALAPLTAFTGTILVKRLSVLDGPAQLVVAVIEPVLLAGAIVTAGLIGQRLGAARPAPVAR